MRLLTRADALQAVEVGHIHNYIVKTSFGMIVLIYWAYSVTTSWGAEIFILLQEVKHHAKNIGLAEATQRG
jgi:hypothetical protein